MSSKICPFVKFNDQKCKEAMTFYKECIGGELELMTVGNSPMASEMPDKLDLIMHSTLTHDGWVLMASDMMMDKAILGDNVGITLTYDNDDEMQAVFDKMAVDGEIFMPIADQFWGSKFGVLTDKYGVEWSFNGPERK